MYNCLGKWGWSGETEESRWTDIIKEVWVDGHYKGSA